MRQDKFFQYVKHYNLELGKEEDDSEWAFKFIDQLENRFAAGYITGVLSCAKGHVSPFENAYKQMIADLDGTTIWHNEYVRQEPAREVAGVDFPAPQPPQPDPTATLTIRNVNIHINVDELPAVNLTNTPPVDYGPVVAFEPRIHGRNLAQPDVQGHALRDGNIQFDLPHGSVSNPPHESVSNPPAGYFDVHNEVMDRYYSSRGTFPYGRMEIAHRGFRVFFEQNGNIVRIERLTNTPRGREMPPARPAITREQDRTA